MEQADELTLPYRFANYAVVLDDLFLLKFASSDIVCKPPYVFFNGFQNSATSTSATQHSTVLANRRLGDAELLRYFDLA